VEQPGDALAIVVNGEEISLHDLLAAAKFRGQLDFVAQAVDAALIRAAAARMQIEVSDAELQAEADNFRASRELYAAKATEAWLAAQHLSQEDWELQLEDDILRRKLRQALCEGKVEQHFAENKRSWEAATVSQIVVADENMARELRAQIVDDEADFRDLARQYSTEDAAPRRCRRHDVDPGLAAAIFGVQPGGIAGPVRSDRGWHLFLVDAFHPAQLDNETRETIAETLFADWLAVERAKAEIRTPILDI
jgi:parvulin-like peptidyl-prolyl isomerase